MRTVVFVRYISTLNFGKIKARNDNEEKFESRK